MLCWSKIKTAAVPALYMYTSEHEYVESVFNVVPIVSVTEKQRFKFVKLAITLFINSTLILTERRYNSGVMKNRKEQWNEYLANRDVRPKTFTLTLERDRSGNFKIVGNKTKMLDAVNQHEAKWVRVDSRNFLTALRNSDVSVA